jgi:DNA-binding NtrC family response regulator
MAFTHQHGRLPRVLLVEPEQALGEMLVGCFEDAGAHAVLVRSRATAGQFVSTMHFELALMASRVEDGSGVALAAELARIQPDIRLALVGDRHSVHARCGGQDFLHAVLVKPIPRQRLLGLLEDALGVHTSSSSAPGVAGIPWTIVT